MWPIHCHLCFIQMSMDSSFAPFQQVLRKLCMFKPWLSSEPLPCYRCIRDSASFKLSYLLAHTSYWGILSILKFSRHKLCIAHDLTLLIPSLSQWEAFPTPDTFTRMVPQLPGVIPGFLCAHDVLGTPHGEVQDRQWHRYSNNTFHQYQMYSNPI